MEQNKRIVYIDLARGAAILAVMWGHVMLTGRTNTLVYAFDIPLFFFMSGMMFRREKYASFKAFFLRRFRTLLAPYAICSVLSWLWWVADNALQGKQGLDIWSPLAQTVLAQGSGGFLVHNVALWFVTCLFALEMIYWFVGKAGNPWKVTALCVVCGLIGAALMKAKITDLPWSLEAAFAAVPFYGAGEMLSRYVGAVHMRDMAKRHPARTLAVCAVSGALLYVLGCGNGHVTMAQGSLGNNTLVFYLAAFSGILWMLSGCILIDDWQFPPFKFLSWFGKNSFWIMATHVPVMLIGVRLVAAACHVSLDQVRLAYRYTVPVFLFMIIVCSAAVAGLQFLYRHFLNKNK